MIDAITLSNFKAFREATIDLRPLTMLSGVNGAGKSTLLQSMAALRQSFEANCLYDGLLLNGELIELGTGRDVLFEHAASPRIGISLRQGEFEAEFNFKYGERADLLESENGFPKGVIDRCDLFSGVVQFLRADRVSPADVYPRSYAQAVRHRFLGTRGQFAAHFLAFHQDEIVAEGRRFDPKGGGTALLDQVNSWLGQIAPGMAVEATELSGADLAQLEFTFGGKAGLASSNAYRPTNVGFGLSYSLPIIVACLSANAGDILLVENPEAHLHPKGQMVMASLLSQVANDGVQVIFESHSDHVLNGVRLAVKHGVLDPNHVSLHYFDLKVGSGGTAVHTPRIDANGRLSSWPVGFFDELERSLMELV